MRIEVSFSGVCGACPLLPRARTHIIHITILSSKGRDDGFGVLRVIALFRGDNRL